MYIVHITSLQFIIIFRFFYVLSLTDIFQYNLLQRVLFLHTHNFFILALYFFSSPPNNFGFIKHVKIGCVSIADTRPALSFC